MYAEDDMLMLSGIQHYLFCPRQWALIHIEQQWEENRLTAEGEVLHQNVDNPFYRQKNGEVITLRSVSLASKQLGLYGIADAIELIPTTDKNNSIAHPRFGSGFLPFPVEYKHGQSKTDDCDRVQLAAQVMCLEEMHQISIHQGALFYWKTKRREIIDIDTALREQTSRMAQEMHMIYKSGTTPPALKNKRCKNCSLLDLCMPQLSQKQNVANYLKSQLYAKTT